jgi:hypothetical protein
MERRVSEVTNSLVTTTQARRDFLKIQLADNGPPFCAPLTVAYNIQSV